MTRQRGEESEPQQVEDDGSGGEFIDRPENLPGDQKKKSPPPKSKS